MTGYRFGARSLARLSTCHPDLQRVMRHAIETAPMDFTILCGHRNQADQDKAVAEGLSKTPWPTGKHNSLPSHAVDIAPLTADGKIDWTYESAFARLARHVLACAGELGVPLRWGGDWNRNGRTRAEGDKAETFVDLPHFELHGAGYVQQIAARGD